MNLKSLLTRTVSGLIYCLILVGCVLCGNMGVILLAALLSTLACVELSKINNELNWNAAPTLILDILGCYALSVACLGWPMLCWMFVIMCRLIEQLYLHSDHPLKDLSASAFSQIYIGLPMAVMVSLSFYMHPNVILALLFFIWINDTGAYLVGSLIGKHRLFERISPKKSWEGFFGALIFTVGLGALFGAFCNGFFLGTAYMNIWLWMGFGAVVTVFGTWGDLVESMIKRDLKIKDSGNVIPGHGGILDRIDSLLLVLPAAAVYFFMVSYFTGFLG